MGKPTGLVRRKGSSNYYFRQRWPERFKRPGTPPDIWITLGTASYATALARLDDARREAHQRFTEPAIPNGKGGIYPRFVRPVWPDDPSLPLLCSEQVAALAKTFFSEAMRTLDADTEMPAVGSDDARQFCDELEDQLARISGRDPDDEIDHISGVKIAVLRKAGVRSLPNSEPSRLLHNYMSRAVAQLCRIRLARLVGDFSDEITDHLFTGDISDYTTMATSKRERRSEATLGHVADRYLAERIMLDPLTPKTRLKRTALLATVTAFFGRDMLICDIERSDCNRFRDVLSKLPPNFSKKRGGHLMSLSEIARANDSGRVLSWETQDQYLKALHRLMAWALKERLVPDNVADDISPLAQRKAAGTHRLPFQPDELTSIFSQPVFTGCVDDERRFAVRGPNVIKRSRYWAPLVALFTGLRMGEILQLTTGHIRRSKAGNLFIVLTPDMNLKTANAEREVPIHPTLCDLGFVEWIEGRRNIGSDDLFDDVPTSKHGYRSDIYSKRFATFLRTVSIAEDRRSKVCFHSFRHTFKDALNETGAPEADMEEICGWSRGERTSRGYGTGFRADRLKPYVEKIEFAIDLSHLFSR